MRRCVDLFAGSTHSQLTHPSLQGPSALRINEFLREAKIVFDEASLALAGVDLKSKGRKSLAAARHDVTYERESLCLAGYALAAHTSSQRLDHLHSQTSLWRVLARGSSTTFTLMYVGIIGGEDRS